MSRLAWAAVAVLLLLASPWATASQAEEHVVRVSTFQVDITPPPGSPLCDGAVQPVKEVVDPLQARGLVLFTGEQPIVLCALDWVGVGNAGYDAWREALARAAGTSVDRVAVQCLHQHDAPGCDLSAEALLAEQGIGGASCNVAFAREAIQRTAAAVKAALANPQRVTHVGHGRAKVDRVASNRRVLGPDGKVKYVRWSATKDDAARAEPEGTVDPEVKLVSFWDGERPLTVLSYYATHPQSYYGQGSVSYDFVGMARQELADALPEVACVHFNGAAGNVTAGKYNNGDPANRAALAGRLAAGMKAAWQATERVPLTAADVRWKVVPVKLPLSQRLDDEQPLESELGNAKARTAARVRAARDLAFARLTKAGHETQLSCLDAGPVSILHMPGELFIEYQLAAQRLMPDRFVCMAAYGDYGAGYIGTEISYTQGGYETGIVSRVSPAVEGVLMAALRKLLD